MNRLMEAAVVRVSAVFAGGGHGHPCLPRCVLLKAAAAATPLCRVLQENDVISFGGCARLRSPSCLSCVPAVFPAAAQPTCTFVSSTHVPCPSCLCYMQPRDHQYARPAAAQPLGMARQAAAAVPGLLCATQPGAPACAAGCCRRGSGHRRCGAHPGTARPRGVQLQPGGASIWAGRSSSSAAAWDHRGWAACRGGGGGDFARAGGSARWGLCWARPGGCCVSLACTGKGLLLSFYLHLSMLALTAGGMTQPGSIPLSGSAALAVDLGSPAPGAAAPEAGAPAAGSPQAPAGEPASSQQAQQQRQQQQGGAAPPDESDDSAGLAALAAYEAYVASQQGSAPQQQQQPAPAHAIAAATAAAPQRQAPTVQVQLPQAADDDVVDLTADSPDLVPTNHLLAGGNWAAGRAGGGAAADVVDLLDASPTKRRHGEDVSAGGRGALPLLLYLLCWTRCWLGIVQCCSPQSVAAVQHG